MFMLCFFTFLSGFWLAWNLFNNEKVGVIVLVWFGM